MKNIAPGGRFPYMCINRIRGLFCAALLFTRCINANQTIIIKNVHFDLINKLKMQLRRTNRSFKKSSRSNIFDNFFRIGC